MQLAANARSQPITEIPRQNWFNLQTINAVVPPGCFFTPPINVDGYDSIVGTVFTSVVSVIYFWQFPMGATILASADIDSIVVPAGVGSKFEMTINYPYVMLSFNPTAVTVLRICFYGVPIRPFSISGLEEEM